MTDIGKAIAFLVETKLGCKKLRDKELSDVCGISIKALEKQIPKELSYEGDGYDDNGELIYDTAFCPSCEKEFEVYYCEHSNYCPNCGQALDWSETSE